MTPFIVPTTFNTLVVFNTLAAFLDVQCKTHILDKHINSIRSFYLKMDEKTGPDKWSANSLAEFTMRALYLQNCSIETLGPAWEVKMYIERCSFLESLGAKSIYTQPLWISQAWRCAFFAQAILFVKNPVSILTAIVSLTTLVAFPIILFLSERAMIHKYRNKMLSVYRFASSYPKTIDPSVFNTFVLNGVFYTNSRKSPFTQQEMNEIVDCLMHDKEPTNLIKAS